MLKSVGPAKSTKEVVIKIRKTNIQMRLTIVHVVWLEGRSLECNPFEIGLGGCRRILGFGGVCFSLWEMVDGCYGRWALSVGYGHWLAHRLQSKPHPLCVVALVFTSLSQNLLSLD